MLCHDALPGGWLAFSRRFPIQSACFTLSSKDAMAYCGRVRAYVVLLVIALSFHSGAADIHYGEFQVFYFFYLCRA